jgi:hypothetical protein
MWSSTCVEAQMTHSRCSNAFNYFILVWQVEDHQVGVCHLFMLFALCSFLHLLSPFLLFQISLSPFQLMSHSCSMWLHYFNLPTHHNWTSFLSILIICFICFILLLLLLLPFHWLHCFVIFYLPTICSLKHLNIWYYVHRLKLLLCFMSAIPNP